MFTGIVQKMGTLISRNTADGDARLEVEVPADLAERINHGDSIAINGVCLTVVERNWNRLWFDVSSETLSATGLGGLEAGTRVNLEPSLSASDPLGGHFVTGHVDGVGKVVKVEPDGRSHRIEVEAPEPIARYIAQKGSITVDGISLTVNDVNDTRFSFNVIPHTWSETNMQSYQTGTSVNLEVDIIARYLERLMGDRDADTASEDITVDFLSKQGFAPPVFDEEDEDAKGIDESPIEPRVDDPNQD